MTTTVSQPIAERKGSAAISAMKVIVRSAFDDLSVLRVVRREGRLVVVASEDMAHQVAVPDTHVFGFSEDRVQALRQAIFAGDPQLLADIWDSLEPYED